MFEFCALVYLAGVVGSLISVLELRQGNYSGMRSMPVITLFISAPFLNYLLMWECFKEVEAQKRIHRNSQANLKKRMSQVNHGKGIS